MANGTISTAQQQDTHPVPAALDPNCYHSGERCNVPRQTGTFSSFEDAQGRLPADGKGGKTIWEGHIMWTTNTAQQVGIDPLRAVL